MAKNAKHNSRRQAVSAVLLLLCIAVVALWEIMSNRSRRPFDPFEITTEDFAAFRPVVPQWSIQQQAVSASRIEPNILAYVLRAVARDSAPPPITQPVQVRLVHGYNMPECMEIKHYGVELIEDRRVDPLADDTPDVTPPPDGIPQHQVWRLTSKTGDQTVWVTSMLRAGDFRDDYIDVRSMAFPRAGTPDDPRWMPEGLSARSFRHPIRNFKWLIRAKWNNSRCDPLTFLRLRRPAWASNEILTLVSNSSGSPGRHDEARVAAHVLAAHTAMYKKFHEWRRTMLRQDQSARLAGSE